jgi:putative DNA methylase
LGSSVTGWMSDRGAFRETFARQAIPMTWDFAEANLFSDSGGNFLTPIEKICTAVAEASKDGPGKVQINDAANGAKFGSQLLIATDPPYYDNVPYADLSDFFYVWLRRTLRDVFSSELATMLVPQKDRELVAEPSRHGGREGAENFFIEGVLLLSIWPA